MNAEEAYDWLIGASESSHHDLFDVHVVAAILALAMAEASDAARPLCEGVGLDGPAFRELAGEMFPDAAAQLGSAYGNPTVTVDEEEQSIRDILGMYRSGASKLETPLIALIARRCKQPHHLWQDLGLRTRLELSQLMSRHFARLADKNRNDMKWKKFLYRMVCGSEGFTLCTSPVCSECDDFASCFGAEDGESRLAIARNKAA